MEPVCEEELYMAENEPLAKVIDPIRVDFEKEGLVYRENVAYGNKSPRQTMDYFYPKDNDGCMPVVIWIHGGGWSDENLTKRYRPEPELAQLAKMGFFIASIEYRLIQHAPFPAQIEDCKCAVRYLRAHAGELGIDPSRIGAWGESAGGHLAALLGTTGSVSEFEGNGGWQEYSSEIQAVCPWYAPYDMMENAKRSDNQPDSLFYRMFGGPVSEKADLIRKASPISYAGEKLPPFFVMHGDSDRLVHISQTENFYTAAKAAGNPVEKLIVPGQGHGFFEGSQYYEAIFDFFCRVFGKKH